MLRSFFAITVGVTALCFAQASQSGKKTESASDPFGGPPAVVRGKDATEAADEDPFGSGQAVDQTSGEDDPFSDEQTKAGQANTDPFGSDPAAAETLDPFSSKPKTGSVAQETERLGSLERKHAALELDANKYAADIRLKYANNQMYPISVRQKLRDKIEAAFDARKKVQRQRIHLARVRLDAAEERLSKGLVRSKFAVERRLEQVLGKQTDQAASAQKDANRFVRKLRNVSSGRSSNSRSQSEFTVPAGMRVVTVRVDETTSHSGMLSPGNRVDVMLTYLEGTDEGSVGRTRMVLEYIEIFAVGRPFGGETRYVSFLVTPQHGRVLLLAQKKGTIHLALRSNDTEHETTKSVFSEDELSGLRVVSKKSEEYAENLSSINAAINSVGKELRARETEYEKFTKSSRMGLVAQILSDRAAAISKTETTVELEIIQVKASIRTIESAAREPEDADAVLRAVRKLRADETVPSTDVAIRLLKGDLSVLENRLEALLKMSAEVHERLRAVRVDEVRRNNLQNEIQRLRETYAELRKRLKDVKLLQSMQ